MGRDGEVAELIARPRAIDRDTDLIAYPIARLAEARRERDVKMAAVAVAEFAGTIQRYRAKVWNTGGVLPWDWYQIGLETLQELSRDQAR